MAGEERDAQEMRDSINNLQLHLEMLVRQKQEEMFDRAADEFAAYFGDVDYPISGSVNFMTGTKNGKRVTVIIPKPDGHQLPGGYFGLIELEIRPEGIEAGGGISKDYFILVNECGHFAETIPIKVWEPGNDQMISEEPEHRTDEELVTEAANLEREISRVEKLELCYMIVEKRTSRLLEDKAGFGQVLREVLE